MFFVGIDVAKKSSEVCIINEKRKIVKKFKLIHNSKNFKKFFEIINKLSNNKNDFEFALEATNVFWKPVFFSIREKGYKISLVNPYSSSYFSKSFNKHTKTDKQDALNLAIQLSTGLIKESLVPENDVSNLRELIKEYNFLMKQIYNLKRRISSILQKTFYEYDIVFRDPFNVTSRTILKKYPSAFALAKANKNDIVKIFRSIKGNNNSEHKAKKIIEFAKISITPNNGIKANEFNLRNQITVLELLLEQIKNIEKNINLILKNLEFNYSDNNNKNSINPIKAVLSIPGVGKKTVATIIGCCGDLNKFNNVNKFLGYIGLYPGKDQSGSKDRTYQKSKGISIVKKQLYCCAVSALMHNNELKQVYLNEINKGGNSKKAIFKVMVKLAKIIWHLYTYSSIYDPVKVFVAKPHCA